MTLMRVADWVHCWVQLITRPMVVGDRVTLRGAAEVVGVVERVDFTRTIIRDDFDTPVSVPNKARVGICFSNLLHMISPARKSLFQMHHACPCLLKQAQISATV